ECHGQSVLPPAHRMILETRLAQAIYACVSAADGYCSCGLGVQVPDEQAGNLFGIFDVCTREDLRRNGHARRLVEILLAAGRDSGATICFLQVIESNIPARKLYESLGFETLYRYWYRVQS
ncbi:MAG: GNAT family N-acetyltransferase, partial [Proteobacteria bacterium]|nr:GNAT family N-acetyltransferase [Pseudomonadota bacterium]